jgi:uncharacterized OB-fold protein
MTGTGEFKQLELKSNLTFKLWEDELREGQLVGHQCQQCSEVTTFPRGACDHCGSTELAAVELPTTGTVYSETTVFVAPEDFESGYQLSLIDLGGTHILARTEGEVEIDETVEFKGITENIGAPAPVFEPK